jgi:hypothetical protein
MKILKLIPGFALTIFAFFAPVKFLVPKKEAEAPKGGTDQNYAGAPETGFENIDASTTTADPNNPDIDPLFPAALPPTPVGLFGCEHSNESQV